MPDFRQHRPQRVTRAASRAAAAALLADSPGEVVAHILKHCKLRDFGALTCTAGWLHPLLELALRLRAGENGHALPQKLQLDDDSCHRRVQAMLSLEWRRTQTGRRTIAAGMSHSLFISPEGTLLSCGTEWDVDGNPTPGLLGHGTRSPPATQHRTPSPLSLPPFLFSLPLGPACPAAARAGIDPRGGLSLFPATRTVHGAAGELAVEELPANSIHVRAALPSYNYTSQIARRCANL